MADVRNWSSATELIRHNARQRAEQDALIWVRDIDAGDSAALRYGELDADVRRIAAGLAHRFPVGSRVLLLYPPVEFIVGFLACLYAGMVAVPAPLPGRYHHERRRVRGIAADAEVAAVLTDAAHQSEVREWASTEGLAELPVLASDIPADLVTEHEWTAPAQDHSTLALLQYTSGSTGEPKGVMVTHGNLLVNASTLFRALGVEEGARFGGWAPHYHDMGLMAQTLPALLLGSTCVLMDALTFVKRPHTWLAMIDRFDIAWSAAPNFGYDLCVRRVTDEQLARLDLSRWRWAVNGSEPVQASTLAAFEKRFAPAGFQAATGCPCYGLAEATVFVSGIGARGPWILNLDAEALQRNEFVPVPEGTSGKTLPANGIAHYYDVRIVDPVSLIECPTGRIGEIWLRSDNVAAGYWRNDKATEETFRAVTADGETGFLRTGDLGALHEGELFVTGRLKDMLIVNGRNLYPSDIEFELRAQHQELGAVGAVFTVPGGEDTEDVVLAHEINGRLEPDAARTLARRMRNTVAREFGVSARSVVLLRKGGVRRTTSGKIERSATRALFMTGELPAEFVDTTEGTDR